MKLKREPFNGQPRSQRFNARFLLPRLFTLPVLGADPAFLDQEAVKPEAV